MRLEVSMVAQSAQLGSKPTRAMHQDKSIDSIISRPDPWALQISTPIAQSQILRSPAPIVLSSKVALGCGLQIQDRKSNCYHSLTGFLHNIAPFVLPKYISQEITNSQWKRSFSLWIAQRYVFPMSKTVHSVQNHSKSDRDHLSLSGPDQRKTWLYVKFYENFYICQDFLDSTYVKFCQRM